MSIHLRIFVEGEPIQQPKHEPFTSKKGKLIEINKERADAWRELLGIQLKLASPFTLGKGCPVKKTFNFYLTPPPLNKNSYPIEAPVPDVDNYAYLVTNVLQKAGVIHNDRQIYDEHHTKRWTNELHPEAGVQITIERM